MQLSIYKVLSWFPLILVLSLIMTGCGTTSPIPAQGGGKRFSIEQAMISASARKAISEIPMDLLQGKAVAVEATVIQDEGGGALTIGGRPYMASIIAGQYDRVQSTVSGNTTGTQTYSGGGKNQQSEPTYFKDITYNGSDARQFNNILTSALLRQNVVITSLQDTSIKPDYLVEVIVDIFGIWRSRTDWMIYNAETLTATTSFEYVITPLKVKSGSRVTGRVGFDATYREKYAFWVGPYETSMDVVPSKFSEIVGTFGSGREINKELVSGLQKTAQAGNPTKDETNLSGKFLPPPKPTPIIINPNDAITRGLGR